MLKAPKRLELLFEAINKSWPVPPGDGKIATSLLQLIEHRQTKGPSDVADKAAELGIPYTDGKASVRLFAASSSAVAALRNSIVSQGGEVQATFDNVVYARLPLGSVKAMGRSKRSLGRTRTAGCIYT